MGRNNVVSLDFETTREADESDSAIRWQDKRLWIDGDAVVVKWGDKLQLTGSYNLRLEIPKSEILYLFKFLFGSNFKRETLESLGIEVIGATPTDEELEKSI